MAEQEENAGGNKSRWLGGAPSAAKNPFKRESRESKSPAGESRSPGAGFSLKKSLSSSSLFGKSLKKSVSSSSIGTVTR